MANYTDLKTAIQNVIKTNGANAITGAILQNALITMINSLGFGYQFRGVATPSTNPGTPDARVFYLAGAPGIYSNMGGANVSSFGVFYYDTQWHYANCGIPFSASSITGGYMTTAVSIDFTNKLITTGGGYLFVGTTTVYQVVASQYSFSEMAGLCYVVISDSDQTIYVTPYSTALSSGSDKIVGCIDITASKALINCRTLTIDGSTIRNYTDSLYFSDGTIKYTTSNISVNYTNKTITFSSGYIFNGRTSYGSSLLAGTTSWDGLTGLCYIVYSNANQSLYIIPYTNNLSGSLDFIIGVLDTTGSRIEINCRQLTIDGNVVLDYTQAEKDIIEQIEEDVAKVVAVTPMPETVITPNSTWPTKNYNNPSGTDGIFWDVRNKIGAAARLAKINLITGTAGTVRVHYIDGSNNTVAYEDHTITSGLNSFAPTTEIDYSQVLFVGFQNITSAVRLIYPTDGTGQVRKKFISDGHVVDQTYPYAFWLDVWDMQNTLPYRVSILEQQAAGGITTLAELKAAISAGEPRIQLAECDITLDATLSLATGTKITGVRGRSILRVPSGVLKGIELSSVEDVVIENITLIGAYNGTPIKNELQPVRPGIVDTAEQARTFYNAGYQTNMSSGGVTSTSVPQIGINIRQCEKLEILGCEIKNFSYYGIANALSGKNYRYAMKVQNNYINNCYCGLYLYKEAERAQYIANNIALCQIGVYLDSGTNMFTDNAFSANRIAMFMNNGVNHAHGVQTGNAFTHCSLFSLYAYNVQNGEVFTQCKFGYVDSETGNESGTAIIVKNSRGLFFNNCQMIQCNISFDGKFYLSYSSYTTGTADQFGNTNYVVSYTDISGQASQYNGGVNEMLGCSFISGGGHITISDDLDTTNVILKYNANITGNTYPAVNN